MPQSVQFAAEQRKEILEPVGFDLMDEGQQVAPTDTSDAAIAAPVAEKRLLEGEYIPGLAQEIKITSGRAVERGCLASARSQYFQ